MKILLAVDGSEFTQQMLAYLAAHDDRLGRQNEFTILTVVPPVPPQVTRFVDQETLNGHYQQIAEDVLRPVRSFAVKQQWNVAIKHLVGAAAETIAKEATDGQFDLLVMGSHGHSALGSLVMGSVAASVIARCKTPVLLIR